MTGEWSTGRLGDCVLLLSGGTPSKSRPDFWVGDVPWVSAKDMKSYWIEDTEDHLSEAGANEATRIVEDGTTLLLVRGMTLHRDVPICRVRRPAAFNQDVKAVLAQPETDPEFVPYLLLGNKAKLLSIVDSAGHGTGRLNSDTLLNLPIHIPPADEQRAIAHILGTLDDKIELNRRINETLEATARVIFRSWFVAFDPVRAKAEGQDPGLPEHIADLFPYGFLDSELGAIPAGWRVRSFAEEVDILGGGTPKTSVPEYWGGDIPWYSVVDSPRDANVFVIDTEKKITHAGIDNSSTRILPTGTSIISARGTVGRVALVGTPMTMNQSCYGLRDRASERGYYTYFATRNLRHP